MLFFAIFAIFSSISDLHPHSICVWKRYKFESVFDNETTSSIGDVAIALNDANLVWVGTGENNNRQSSSWGDGVYKSTDGGKTWKNMGLGDSHQIARIIVDPVDHDVVYVAALGSLWGPGGDRGVYKTGDGGLTRWFAGQQHLARAERCTLRVRHRQ